MLDSETDGSTGRGGEVGMIIEKVDYPFLHREMIREYRKTLLDIGSGPFAAIACDQGGSLDYQIYNATKYAVELIEKELEELKEREKKLFSELSEKYGEKGVDKDWFITMDGSVHLTKKNKED